MSRRATPESFWARVNILDPDDCWEWQGAITSGGYGNLTYRGTSAVAHRVAYFLEYGEITLTAPKNRKGDGFVLHDCDNRKCCNPKHLHLGTLSKNMYEAYERNHKAPFKGAMHTNAKLLWEEVEEIRRKYKRGIVQVALAKEYKVSQRVISLIVRGESYQ